MDIRSKTREGQEERRVLIAMIVDDSVTAFVSERWSKPMFKSKFGDLVGGWCVEHFQKYGTAPGRQIRGWYERWLEVAQDNKLIDAVGRLLESLSDEYETRKEESNTQYELDLAGRHFNKCQLSRLYDEGQQYLEIGDLDQARQRLEGFQWLESTQDGWVDVLHDDDALRMVFEQSRESVVQYPEAVARFFRNALARDNLVAFMGPEKRGKTFMLLDLAWRAMLQRRKVAFFEIGDMSLPQIMGRFAARAVRRPLDAGTLRYPTSIQLVEDEEGKRQPHVEFEEREYADPVTFGEVRKARNKVIKSRIKSDETYLRLKVTENDSTSVDGIEAHLRGLARRGWVPDVVCIDYADLITIPGNVDPREGTNRIWKRLRAISQRYHCLVATATQAKATSYEAHTIGKKHFSEDKRKLAHASGIIGLSSTPAEHDQGVLRLGWVVLRENEYSEQDRVYLATCRGVADMVVRCCDWRDRPHHD